jgi:hypothetical protein
MESAPHRFSIGGCKFTDGAMAIARHHGTNSMNIMGLTTGSDLLNPLGHWIRNLFPVCGLQGLYLNPGQISMLIMKGNSDLAPFAFTVRARSARTVNAGFGGAKRRRN